MEINYLAVLVASLLQFVVGAVWYMPLFGNLWGRIHGFEGYSKQEQQQMARSMGPYYALQFVVTILTTLVLALLANGLPADWNLYGLAGFAWIGFVVPTQVSAVIFGGTEPKWIAKKILVMAGGSIACLMVAAAVLSWM